MGGPQGAALGLVAAAATGERATQRCRACRVVLGRLEYSKLALSTLHLIHTCGIQALAAADQLELLDWTGIGVQNVPFDIKTLVGLRHLRRLLVACRGPPPAGLERQLRAALPALHKLTVGSMMQNRSVAAFLREAEQIGADGGEGSATDSEGSSDDE